MVRPVPQAVRSEGGSNPTRPRQRCGERSSSEGKRDHKFGGDDPEPPIDEGKAEIDPGNERECQGGKQNWCLGWQGEVDRQGQDGEATASKQWVGGHDMVLSVLWHSLTIGR